MYPERRSVQYMSGYFHHGWSLLETSPFGLKSVIFFAAVSQQIDVGRSCARKVWGV